MQQRVEPLLSVCARLPSSWLKRALLGVLLLLICQQLATLTWRLWLPASPLTQDVQLSPAHAKMSPSQTRIYTLFGRSPLAASLKPVPEAALAGDIPLSTLQVTLTGIVASKQTERSIAIIAKDSRQFSRSVGDAVPGYEARIVTISADRIVLEHQGRYEALYLYRDADAAAGAKAQSTRAPALSGIRETLKTRPMQLMDYLSIVPLMKDNQLTGYRLNPGKQADLFYQVGLQDNDLAVALNGLDLRDAQQGQQAMAQLPQLSELTLTLERSGQRQDIVLTLDAAATKGDAPQGTATDNADTAVHDAETQASAEPAVEEQAAEE